MNDEPERFYRAVDAVVARRMAARAAAGEALIAEAVLLQRLDMLARLVLVDEGVDRPLAVASLL